MRKTYKFIALTLAMLLLSGCGEVAKEPMAQEAEPAESNQNAVVSTVIDTADMFSDRDFETDYNANKCEKIVLNGSTVEIKKEGNYILSGALEDGQVIVNVDKSQKVQLILDGVTIHSNSSAASIKRYCNLYPLY